MMYTSKDKERFFSEENDLLAEYRTVWRRDYARLLHSPSFRRLQGKTQLFPSFESDFFRTRLSHSLEVAQVAKSIAISINYNHLKDLGEDKCLDLDLVETAGLAHDLGHPPFGHQGEEALDECMFEYGGFEGNAQTLRILSKLEKKMHDGDLSLGGFTSDGEDRRFGLNLTYRTLAAILKYDSEIPIKREKQEDGTIKLAKGYYINERPLVDSLKRYVLGEKAVDSPFKTVECQIMDIADDIAYSTYDLEDAFKAGFINPFDILFAEKSFYEGVSKSVSKNLEREVLIIEIKAVLLNTFQNVFDIKFNDLVANPEKESDSFIAYLSAQYSYRQAQLQAKNGYLRTKFTSYLIDEFVKSVEFEYNEQIPALSKVKLRDEIRLKVEVLKKVAFQSQVLSPKLKTAEYRGKEIVKRIFDTLVDRKGYGLLPDDYRTLYAVTKNDVVHSRRIICDYIASMTDKYAIEFYGRLTSENPELYLSHIKRYSCYFP